MDSLTKRLSEALELLIDDDECDFDHHGYCQTHFSGSKPCVMKEAIDALKEYRKAVEDESK